MIPVQSSEASIGFTLSVGLSVCIIIVRKPAKIPFNKSTSNSITLFVSECTKMSPPFLHVLLLVHQLIGPQKYIPSSAHKAVHPIATATFYFLEVFLPMLVRLHVSAVNG